MTRCICGTRVASSSARGRPAVYCSSVCKQRDYRNRSALPTIMRSECRWVRCVGKRPVMVDGSPASSTDRGTWVAFDEVQGGAGNGLGVMLGGGLGCYDLDHVTDDEAWELIAAIPEPVLYVERSVSGEGFHVFVEADEAPGWKRGRVERYTRARFIRVTLDRVTMLDCGGMRRRVG